MTLYRRLARPLLFAMDAERAHQASLSLLKRMPALRTPPVHDASLAVEAFGLRFPNPLGLAAGYDKNAEAVDALLRLGFGFVEAGTVTPWPQPGNPKPRLFRLSQDFAVINRFGFNSHGRARVLRRLERRAPRPGLVGVNLGANKDSADRAQDYVLGVETFHAVASYFTINISSPNTPGLRALQASAALRDLLERVLAARERVLEPGGRRKPILLKIAPDLEPGELDQIVRAARDARIDGMIVSNTTVIPPPTWDDRKIEAGGLSGRPLFEPSTRVLAQTYLRVEGAFPLVGVGGIENAATAWAKIEAGATLVQLYSALAFHGPGLARRILSGLSERAKTSPLAQTVGRRAADFASG